MKQVYKDEMKQVYKDEMKQVYNGDEVIVRRMSSEYREGSCMILDMTGGLNRINVPWAVAVEIAKGILKVEGDSTLKTYDTNTTSTGLRAAPPEYGGMM